MAQETLNIGDTGADFISHSNANFTELYGNLVAYSWQSCANGTTVNMIIGDITTDRAIFVKYALTRGSGVRVGELKIIHDGSTLYYGAENFISNDLSGVGDPGVIVFADINGSDIRLRMTLDSSGSSAVIYYNTEIVPIP